MKQAMILMNKKSGDEQAENYLDHAKEVLSEKNYEVHVHDISSLEDILNGTKEACQNKYDLLLVMGGDGTVSGAINGMKDEEHKPTLGIVPAGTMNNIAKGLGISHKPVEAIGELVNDVPFKMDVGRLNDQLFVSTISAGSIPKTVLEVDDDLKKELGSFAYIKKGIEALGDGDPMPLHIELDGEKEIDEETRLLVIGVGNSIFGVPNFFPASSYNDGKLTLFGVKEHTFGETLSVFFKLLNNQPYDEKDKAYLSTFKKAKIKMTGENFPVTVDGEKGPEFPLDLEVLPEFVRVLVPENSPVFQDEAK